MFKTSPKKALSKVSIPCFFIHGKKDSVIPFTHSVENYEDCGSKVKECVLVDDAEHGMCYYEEYPNLENRIMDFIDKSIGE
jgi:fermentation-respiration switch protein FrsA (DUF1100 family)